MKKITCLLFLGLYGLHSFAQRIDNTNEVKQLYETAIINCIKNISNLEVNKDNSEILNQLNFSTDRVLLEFLPEKFEDNPINYINIYDKRNRKIIKRGIDLLTPQPIKIQDNLIEIVIISHTLKFRNRTFEFAYGAAYKYEFEYSCILKKWLLKKEEIIGI